MLGVSQDTSVGLEFIIPGEIASARLDSKREDSQTVLELPDGMSGLASEHLRGLAI